MLCVGENVHLNHNFVVLFLKQKVHYFCAHMCCFEIDLFVVLCHLLDATLITHQYVFLLVTDIPINFTAIRTGLQTANISWTAPASNIPPVEGYEVFYESESGVRSSGGSVTASQLSLTLSSLEPDVSYTAFVVAFGGDLPSAHSNIANITAGKI